ARWWPPGAWSGSLGGQRGSRRRPGATRRCAGAIAGSLSAAGRPARSSTTPQSTSRCQCHGGQSYQTRLACLSLGESLRGVINRMADSRADNGGGLGSAFKSCGEGGELLACGVKMIAEAAQAAGRFFSAGANQVAPAQVQIACADGRLGELG